MEENKQVRVDNWGVFFLQRLQLFFNKTDYCDLTLQFQGNVQLKVHRLVLNACTEYFELLEQSDRLIDDNVILMPETLQPDVVVPIINFMYTGMLEYPQMIYNRLCQAADLMHISVLTKLLDAQKPSPLLNKTEKFPKQKFKDVKPDSSLHVFSPQTKKSAPKSIISDVSSPIFPTRKLSGWKKKPLSASSSNSSFSCRPDSMNRTSDPLALDEAKPTRFEWPDDDLELPNLDSMMDISGFGDISYNSKPLLREDDVKPILSKNDSLTKQSSKDSIHEIDMDERSNPETSRNGIEKRKAETGVDRSPKRIKIVESEKDTTISVIANENSANFDPTKIVSEILKKYPHLVKKKKNIKLKIVSKHNEKDTPKAYSPAEKTVIEKAPIKTIPRKTPVVKSEPNKTNSKDSVWTCKECSAAHGEPIEFMLYYLYRKHMTDLHNMKFDPRICKYCGIAFSKSEQHAYHLFTKHGIKPSGGQVFPNCSQCPYVAVSQEALQTHKNKHKKSEMQCSCCKLAFISSEAIAVHLQITSHMGKTKKNVFDCQYCTKTSQSPISLLSHIKSNHEMEGKRDGIVSLDEVDLEEGDILEETVEEEEPIEEYIVPETQKNKVKIISDVTVPVSKSKTTTETVTLDQTKSHVSVPTSIATSLGLLDIVVLDENQQFILHNQPQQTGNNQTEYILPQIDARNVTAEGLPSNDELVMVLTDQDYKDGHSGITTENSNIVVLYSHPADGQQGQFITSQGNLMVNSETGMLEIRNGAAIATTSANQIVVSAPTESHIETIEMIQREIEEGQELKQESYYADQKTKVLEHPQEPVHYIENTPVETISEPSAHVEMTENSETQTEEVTKPQEVEEETVVEPVPASDLPMLNDTVEEHTSTMTEEIQPSSNPEESDKSAEMTEACAEESKDSAPMEIEEQLAEECPSPREVIATSECKEEEITTHEMNEENTSISENDISIPEKDTSISESVQEEEQKEEEEAEERTDVGKEQSTDDQTVVPMEVDEAATEHIEENSTEEENSEQAIKPSTEDTENSVERPPSPTIVKDEEKPYSPTDNPVDMDCEMEQDLGEKHDGESLNESSTTTCERELDSQETIVSTQSSQFVEEDTEDKHSEGTKESTTMSILDDWEDTDSQQSDSKTKCLKKGAQETVHKLMDDWDEEEIEK